LRCACSARSSSSAAVRSSSAAVRSSSARAFVERGRAFVERLLDALDDEHDGGRQHAGEE